MSYDCAADERPHQWVFKYEEAGIAYFECSVCEAERMEDMNDDLNAPPMDQSFAERFGCLGVVLLCGVFWFCVYLVWRTCF